MRLCILSEDEKDWNMGACRTSPNSICDSRTEDRSCSARLINQVWRNLALRIRKKHCTFLMLLACFVYLLFVIPDMSVQYGCETNERSTVSNSTSSSSYPSYCLTPLYKTQNIQCTRIMYGDAEYIRSLNSSEFPRDNQTCNLTSLISNCNELTSRHGYLSKHVTPEEVEFPLAFGIKVHTDPIQVEQLLRTIYRQHNVYCIHVDLKSDKSVSEPLINLAKCFDNVFVLQEYRVVYSSIRQTLSDLACMRKVLSTDVKWKYYIIVAGQEFFLKTNLETVRILKILNGTNDIELYPLPKHQQWRVNKRHPITKDQILKNSKMNKLPFSHNITLYKGSSYGMLSRDFVKFVLESQISKDLLSWASDAYAPEEIIWATLNTLPGAPGGYKIYVEHDKQDFLSRAMVWKWDKTKCHGILVHSVCVFTYKDLPWLVSAPEVVANKFHSDYDQLAVDCLEEWLQNKTRLGQTVNMNWYYYRHVPHMKEKESKIYDVTTLSVS